MSSGGRRIVNNTRERLISSDFNRLQAFQEAERSELLNALATPNYVAMDFVSSAVIPTTTSASDATVLAGLTVVAPVAGVELAVQAGEALLIAPDAVPDPDDSPAKLCRSSGVLVGSGTLPLTPNASGLLRIDVVECRRVPTLTVQETDTRDVFDLTAAGFVPSLVNKVTAESLEFRVRLGTPGAGFPGSATGWVPLAVMGVPNGTVTLDTVSMYDVRPLVSDRWPNSLARGSFFVPPRQANLWLDHWTAPGEERLNGIFWSEFRGYRVGGKLALINAGTGATQEYVDLLEWTEPGFIPVADTLAHLWLVFPYDLPRWQHYSDFAVAPYGGRIPYGMRGIPVLTSSYPNDFAGRAPFAPITLPGNSYLDGSVSEGRYICGAQYEAGPTLIPFSDDGDWQSFGLEASGYGSVILSAAVAGGLVYFDVPYNVEIPRCAKALRALVSISLTGGLSQEFTHNMQACAARSAATGQIISWGAGRATNAKLDGAGTLSIVATLEFPLIQQEPDLGLTPRVAVAISPSGGVTITGGAMIVQGFKL